MKAVLINSGEVRLGEVRVSDNCMLINFGGAYFVRTEDQALTQVGEPLGIIFVQAIVDVIRDLDQFKPTRNFSAERR